MKFIDLKKLIECCDFVRDQRLGDNSTTTVLLGPNPKVGGL